MRIKAKAGYNVIISDINVVLQSGLNPIYITREAFDKSQDVKRVMHLIDIVEDDEDREVGVNASETVENTIENTVDTTKATMVNQQENLIKKTSSAFVVDNSEPKKTEGVVVADPNSELNKTLVNSLSQQQLSSNTQVERKKNVQQQKVEPEKAKTDAEKAKAEVERTKADTEKVKVDAGKVEPAVENKPEIKIEINAETEPAKNDKKVEAKLSKAEKKAKKLKEESTDKNAVKRSDDELLSLADM